MPVYTPSVPKSPKSSWPSPRQGATDLSTPHPELGFDGLKPGDCWCLCAQRWLEAYQAGAAPVVLLASTHEATLKHVPLALLKEYAQDLH